MYKRIILKFQLLIGGVMNLRNIFILICFLNLPLILLAKEAATPTATPTAAPNMKENTETSTSLDSSAASEMSPAGEKGKTSWGQLGLTGSLALPHVIEYGLDYLSPGKMLSSSFVIGGYKFKAGDVSAGISSYDLRGRWHPFMGSFFLGLAYGTQKISVEAKDTVNTFETIVKLDIKSAYLMPHIGWLAVWDSGFTLGFDLGMIMPSGVSTTLSTDIPSATASQKDAVVTSSDYLKLKKDAESSGDKLGKTSIPYITLLKIGWMF
jgi:hypothetical protein